MEEKRREKENGSQKNETRRKPTTHVGELLDEVVVLEEDRACFVLWKEVGVEVVEVGVRGEKKIEPKRRAEKSNSASLSPARPPPLFLF